ncbi:hypothetical protein ACEH19_003286 [Enterobacter hormaechei]|uniref:hypothetical protein n=1 Tax=Enterobacter hormaechei TaxID=158836 RepID=UPI000CEC2F8D|nr:hypothetical protein [Enterobacter hormaechei]EMA4504062.1 hypothetical protein [Enterobacter hormaechei]EMF0809849.1 hypothetical protein [Enterobacter hormaechei]MBY7159022.1 hypothetical protein [Enterobacter hormaechei]ROD25135.1 hypothetical protein C4Z15_021750 [Enterobacter hormaechei subsp. xiangfangensis]
MTIYSGIQQKLTEYRAQQGIYWADLQQRINSFGTDLVSYLGVEGFGLCDSRDNKYSVVTVGMMDGDNVKKAPPFLMEKIEGQVNSLHFYLQVNLSEFGSEILDCAMTFECYFRKEHGDYFINIAGKDIECRSVNDKCDFTSVFDYVVKKLEEFVDKSRYE